MEVTLDTLKRLLGFSVAPTVGLLGYDATGLIVGLVVSVVLYQFRPRLLQELEVRPAVPVVDDSPLDIPSGAEACRDAINQYTRWLRECKNNCTVCSHYSVDASIRCALLAPMKGLLPDGDPFVYVIDQTNALLAQNILLLRENNRLRAQEEVRQIPWIKYLQVFMTAIIMGGVGQILAYIVASL